MGIKTANITVYPISVSIQITNRFVLVLWKGFLITILSWYILASIHFSCSFFFKAIGIVVLNNSSIKLDEPKVISINLIAYSA